MDEGGEGRPLPAELQNGLDLATDVELDADTFHVGAHGFDGDVELVGDFLIDVAGGEESEDLAFAGREGFVFLGNLPVLPEVLRDLPGDVAGEGGTAGVNVADGVEEFLGGAGFEEVAAGSFAQGIEDVVFFFVSGEHDDFGTRAGFFERTDAIDS